MPVQSDGRTPRESAESGLPGLSDPADGKTNKGDHRKAVTIMMKTAELTLPQEWDKTFPKSDKVNHSKLTFVNHFGITLAADMYVPKNANRKLNH